MKSQPQIAEAFAPFQQALEQGWSKALESFQSLGTGMPTGGGAWQTPQFSLAGDKLKALREQYVSDAAELWRDGFQAKPSGDRRFSNEAWGSNPVASFAAAVYLLNARTLMGMAEAVEGDEKTRARLRFAVEQWIAASAPSNYLAFNAEAQKLAVSSKGESIARGVQNLLKDMKQGHVSMTDESVFEVGRNVATSEGAVVFENELIQLLEYKPLGAKVYERPFLLVPPCINKFYILDLQPENSLIRYAVEQGHRVFVVSWRNPDASLADRSWDDYIGNAAIRAIEVVQELTGAPKLNTLGFCVGGTILSTALAVLAARGEKPAASVTLLTTLLDFSDTGILDIFIDESMVKFREMQMGQGGLLPGKDLASTFSFLRPNDLVWNYVVGNYLKGETPPPFDLLYWNGDSTNLPGPFYAWYLRNTYLENKLKVPNALTVCGEKIDLRNIDVPTYLYASREDHIVPWQTAYASTRLLGGDVRFVLGASGHIAGVINPPAKKKRNHWVGSLADDADRWLEQAQDVPGSWWPAWADWLGRHAGRKVAAPQSAGSRKYKPIEPAPGRYVKAKAP